MRHACVGGAAFLEYPIGGEGGEDLFALSPGGRRPHGGSLPFERCCCCADIFLGLLGHEDEVVVGLRLGLEKCVSASCVPLRGIEYNANGVLEIVFF